MKNIIRNARLMGAALALAAGLAGCGGGGGGGSATTVTDTCGTPTSATLPVVPVTTNITTATTWNAGSVYYVNSSYSVTAPLTIQAGAVVKFATGIAGGASLTVSGAGSITANGNSSASVVFTSYKDDSVGGDSNSDGTATAAAASDWGKIALDTDGSVFNCVKFSYGGKTNSTLDIGNGTANSATVTNSTFAHNNGGDSSTGSVTLSTDAHGALDASLATAATVITGNTFYGNNVPLSISGKFSIDDSNVFHNPADATVTNRYNGIFHTGQSSKPVIGAITYAETEVPFVLAGYIDVPDGSQLTLGDNVIIKFFDASSTLNTNYNNTVTLNPSAKIIANASAGNKITFTSYKDDTHGGDTNGNGTSNGTVGDWARVVLNADGSIFNRCEFYYGGWDTANRETLNLTTYSATVTNSTFAHNHGGTVTGTFGTEYGVLNAANATAATVITGNTFYDNSLPLEISGKFSLDDSNVFHDPTTPATRNTYNGILFTGNSANYFSTITLSATEVPFAIMGDIWVTSTNTLTLGNNVAFKFYGTASKITVEGSISNQTGTGVVFTSLKDDTVKGDTNADSTTTSPGSADWNGIRDAAWNYTVLSNGYYYKCSSGSVC